MSKLDNYDLQALSAGFDHVTECSDVEVNGALQLLHAAAEDLLHVELKDSDEHYNKMLQVASQQQALDKATEKRDRTRLLGLLVTYIQNGELDPNLKDTQGMFDQLLVAGEAFVEYEGTDCEIGDKFEGNGDPYEDWDPTL